MMNIATSALRWLALASCLALTLGCGSEGGGGSDDETNGGGGNGDTDPGLENATLELTADRPTVPSAGTEPVTITATVKDSNNVLREGVELAFSADSGSLSTGDQPTPTTDQAGRTSVELRAGSDPSPRTITVQAAIVTPEDPAPFETEATDGAGTDSISLEVTGTTLTITGPDIIQSGAESEFVAVLRNSDDQGIPGRELTASTTNDSSLEATNLTTDSQGRVTFVVEGSDTVDSDTLTVQGLGQTTSAGFDIRLETLQFVEPSPTAEVQLGVDSDHEFTIEFSDTSGPVSNETMEFSISRGLFVDNDEETITKTTDANGQATVIARSGNAGLSTVTATGGGLTTDFEFQFVGTDPDTITVTTQDSEIAPQTETTVEAVVRDANLNPVADAQVNFNITQDPSQGGLSANTVTTNSSGVAQTVFTGGADISGQDGVVLTADVQGTGLSDTTTLTVSEAALSVSLGTGNELTQLTPTEYSDPWAVAVTNSTGAPAGDRDVTVSVKAIDFIKGAWTPTEDDEWFASTAAVCPSEDANGNNSIDPGEDLDSDGKLEPNVPVLSANELTTESDGRTSFEIIYPETEAAWVRVQLRAVVENSAGTAFTDTATLRLKALADDTDSTDEAPPGGQTASRYGVSPDCSDPS